MHNVFDESRINHLILQNRLVRSATWEGMADDSGAPTAKLAAYCRTLAKGGIGLIISGYAAVSPEGLQLPGQLLIADDRSAGAYGDLANAVHAEGGKILLQLVHCGGQASSRVSGQRTVAPTAIKTEQYSEEPTELSRGDIERVISGFAAAAGRAKSWGFDGVQLHAAHGYLISQFLSPLTNHRSDPYGGDSEKRRTFLLEVFRTCRTAVGKEFPILVKLNGSDNLAGGCTTDEAVTTAQALAAEGVDAIEVSGGTPASGKETPVRVGIERREDEAYNLPAALRIKEAVSCPVMVVGGFRSFEMVEGVLRRQEADYVSLSRPLIREPNLPRRWQEGERGRARCISCNGCFKPGLKEGGIYCVVEKIERENRTTTL
ncbi:MAG TPA: NADH:flavin oxidoreductase [Geobacterales bacterium]|nr:NADH:flavin oxidoreductase [Geobacterales bacterium]